ncbi:hypothetical protein [Paenibacillus radicis (ex Gao et al. 2016)]|uniref:VCBS repeat-containing protein n=1 Tax=Paenibacillus radicis (ex Gao et al. 2016) TaxID=1737354 RepID=A0A917HTB4_9BACL|nr:hypothetical protein [Paenibacillus radicis (ex Gao et al. 2016)]GGG88566.1 hypothetical protein GCM10010918_53920 [Paenibacillus radicis (ex Gao et al. 2016)]
MLNKHIKGGILLFALVLLGGCGIPTTPADTIKPPVSEASIQRDQMNREFMKLLPNKAQLIVPMQGNEGDNITFGDMDGDGINEAVVVYEEKKGTGRTLKAALFKQNNANAQWKKIFEVKGFGYGLDFVGFPDLNHDGMSELALGWSLGAAGNGLDIYELSKDKLELLSKKEYQDTLELE